MTFRTKMLSLGLLLALAGCSAVTSPAASPTPDRVAILLEAASQARQAENREAEALALRDAVELLAQKQEQPAFQLETVRQACVQAMVEAGGHASSYRLWSDIEDGNGPSNETKRMKERARNLMLQQAEELQRQVQIDHSKGHHQTALCTALASQELLRQASADPSQVTQAETLVQQAQEKLAIPKKESEANSG